MPSCEGHAPERRAREPHRRSLHVTINVYFPAAAAETADQIIDSVTSRRWREPGHARPRRPTRPAHRGGRSLRPVASAAELRAARRVLLVAAGRVLELLLVPAARADRPARPRHFVARIARSPKVDEGAVRGPRNYFASGVVGLTANGLVEVQ